MVTAANQCPHTEPLKAVPQLKGGLPIIGHTVGFVRDLMGLLERARQQCGPVAGIKMLGRQMVLVTGPAAQEEVFKSPDDVLSPKAAYKLMVPIFGKGVAYDCEDAVMDEQLKMLLPALQNKRMRTYSGYIVDEVERSLEGWGESGVVPLVDYFAELTNFTSSRCLLGPEFRGEMSEEFSRVYHDMERGIVPIAFFNAHLPLPSFRRRDRARARLGEMVSAIVDKRRQSDEVYEDFTQTLMESTYSDGRGLSDHEITGLLVAAMFAGHHTSSVTTAWCILELLQHPEWMKRVTDELDTVYGQGREIDFKSLRELPMTEWVVKEVLRLHPPLFILIREALQDTSVLGHSIPKGTWVALSPSVAHGLESVFEDAKGFCPFRFGPPREEDKREPFGYIAFGGGRHKCLGNAFAILQIKTILAILLQRYTFELTDDPVEPDFQAMVIGPKKPARVRYQERTVREASTMTSGAAASAVSQTGQETLRVVVDLDVCQGHGVCEGEAPEVFKVDAQGNLTVLQTEPDPAHHAAVRAAATHCPQQAITIEG
ncbi:MAG: cytochrome P450 [Myxococcota bacterium]|nr:cytochrome P450 [Myxococcota bacterium]